MSTPPRSEAERTNPTSPKVGLWEWDLQSNRVTYSPAWKRLIGYLDSELSDDFREWETRIHPEDQAEARKQFQEYMAGSSSEYEGKFRIRHKDGSWRLILASALLFSGADGRRRLVGSNVDITDLSRTTLRDGTSERTGEEERWLSTRFFEDLNRVDQAIQGTNDLEQVMRDVLDVLLSIFECDRAWLGFPCDPDAPSWRVPMVRTRPECSSLLATGDEIHMSEEFAAVLRALLATNGPLAFGPGGDQTLPSRAEPLYGVQSMICLSIQPKGSRPWIFGLHQCSHARVWTLNEKNLFREVGRRLADGLTGLLTLRKEQEANAKLIEISEGISDLFSAYDRDWRVIQVNKRAARAAGMTREDMLGKRLWDLFPERVGNVSHLHLTRVMESRIPEDYEVHVSSIDLWLEVHAYPTAEGVAVCARDITDRKRAEEMLRWRTAFFEAQVDSALDGIVVVDSQGKRILQNQRMNVLWGIPPEIFKNPDDAAQLQFATSRTKNPKQFAEKVAYLYAHPNEISKDEVELIDGKVLERYSSPVRDSGGKHYGRIWTFRDITERRRLEEQFRQSQKMEAIGQLSGGIAHDFNNFLAVVEMQSSVLLSVPVSAQETKEGLHLIISACERAAHLTRQLLTFSRRSVRAAKDINLVEIAAGMTMLLHRLLGEDILLETRFEPSLPQINADAGMMEQVVMNLALNARDAMPDGGRLTVALGVIELDSGYVALHPQGRQGSFVCLEVSDTGCGIPPENLSRIFEPFFTTKEKGKGTGLGLATVFGIVELHEGWIDVRSGLGEGTTFQVFFPASSTAGNSIQNSSLPPASPRGSETILLVEDEPQLRDLARLVLERQGYHVLQAGSGAEALKRWATLSAPVDLLLTDLIMPGGMSGHDLAEKLRGMHPPLKVMYTSGYNNDFIKRRFRLEPGRNFLQKPCSSADLVATVRRCLDEDRNGTSLTSPAIGGELAE